MSRTRLIGVGLVSSLFQTGKKNSGLFRFFDFAGNNIITEPEWIRGLSLFVRGKFEERLQIVWTVGHYSILMVSSLSLPPYSISLPSPLASSLTPVIHPLSLPSYFSLHFSSPVCLSPPSIPFLPLPLVALLLSPPPFYLLFLFLLLNLIIFRCVLASL